jgi:chromosome partitioning protein
MKIALVAKKGGVGKTTLCLLLYEAFKRAERTVAVRDYDAQGSASKALDAFGGQKESPGQTYDILIIDTPPSLSAPATAAAVTEANIILVPTTPTPLDLWEADEAAVFARERNQTAKIRVVLNRSQRGTLLTQAFAQSAGALSAKPLNAALSHRQAFAQAAVLGWQALDKSAKEELLELAWLVTNL